MSEETLKKLSYNYEDNLELIKYAKNGDKSALNKLIEVNLPLVSAISKKFLK